MGKIAKTRLIIGQVEKVGKVDKDCFVSPVVFKIKSYDSSKMRRNCQK